MAVQPVILRIYEVHFIPLGPALTPALSGLIMSILPALEEESGEFYERCLKLLDQMCKATSTEMFYRALWKAYVHVYGWNGMAPPAGGGSSVREEEEGAETSVPLCS